MINDSTRQKLLEKILNSQEFASSSVYGNYLKYLVQSSIEEKNLKETTIAIEFFEKDSDFNPAEDTIVRSHTYKLRKKLERYYFTEGKDDKFRFKIPKGHYEVAIIKINENKFAPHNLLFLFKTHYQLLIIILLITAFVLALLEVTSLKKKLEDYIVVNPDNFIWKEITHSKLPTLVVPGDHFLFNFRSNELNREFGVRDMAINSIQDLDSLKARFPNKNLVQSPEPYFPYHSIWSLPSVLSVLFSYNQKIIMRKASAISPQMLDEYNVVYLGSIKTLYTLRHLLSRTHFDFNISPHEIKYTDPDSNITRTYSTNLHSSGPNEDLVLALKLRGPVNNTIYMITSYHSLGAPEIAGYLINPEAEIELKNIFSKKYNTTPEYFGILFKVTGIDKTAYKTEVLEYEMYNSK